MRITILTLCSLFFAANACASSSYISCPNPKIIKKTSFDEVQKGDHPGIWTLIQKDNYKSSYQWTFSLILEADNENEATRKGKKLLNSLKLKGQGKKENSSFVCDYKVKGGLMAIAQTQIKDH